MRVVLSTRQCILLTGRCLVSVRFYLVYRVGLVDKIFGLVDLVNKALGLVNKPKWHFEMACILLMPDAMQLMLKDTPRWRSEKLARSELRIDVRSFAQCF